MPGTDGSTRRCAISQPGTSRQTPDVLITDFTRLQHVLVSVGSSFQKPATAYLDKPITLMPAIERSIRSLVDELNQVPLETQSPIEKVNETGVSGITIETVHRWYSISRANRLVVLARPDQ